MLKLLFENDSKEEALKMRDMICKALKDVPGFNTNEIIVQSNYIDGEESEDGNMEIVAEGHKLQHVVEIVIIGDENDSSVTHYTHTIITKISENKRIQKWQ